MPKYVKLKDNMIELDGEIKVLNLPNFTEALWVHKKKVNITMFLMPVVFLKRFIMQ